jgi:hypothetical protein
MPLGYINDSSPRTPPNTVGVSGFGIKGNCGEDHGDSGNFFQQQQQQHDLQQQPDNAVVQSTTTGYFDPSACNFGMPVQMVGMPVQMVQTPYVAMGDSSTFTQLADGSMMQPGMMQYDGQQGMMQPYFMPMTQFVQMNGMQSLQAIGVPASPDDQNCMQRDAGRMARGSNNNFENQQYNKGVMKHPHTIGDTKGQRGPNGRKQKDTNESNGRTEGPRAVLVDLSRLRPVHQASNRSGLSAWHRNRSMGVRM